MAKLKIGQLNLHNDKVATAELDRLVIEYSLDIVLVQEQYQSAGLRSKIVQINNKARAGIYVSRSSFTVTALNNLSSSHCAVAEVSCPSFRVYVVSCYFQFSDRVDPHLHHLRSVLYALPRQAVVIGADANASSPLWFGKLRSTDADRRAAVEEFIAEMHLEIHNTSDAPPTFSGPMGESSIDVTLSSAYVNISYWRVLPDASCSDHRLIVYEYIPKQTQDIAPRSQSFRYKTRRADWCFFSSLFASHAGDFTHPRLTATESAELMSDTFNYCADVTLGRTSISSVKRCDWWNDSLVGIRKKFRSARRKFNKAKKSLGQDSSSDRYDSALINLRVARSHYRAAVLKSKNSLLRKVVDRLDKEGPWSPIYHEFKANRATDQAFVSNIKINDAHTLGVKETAEALLNALIPDDTTVNDTDYHREVRLMAAVPPMSPSSDLPTLDEFVKIVRALPVNKASGEDKISNKMIQEAVKSAGDSILIVYNRCIAEGVFPQIWRRGLIKIIPKSGDKPPDDPKSYRPITLLPSLGKLLERLIVPRLLPGGPTFHERQFGFTIGKSTIDAAISVRKTVESSEFKYVIGVFLDISGAFDNAWWPILLLKLKNRGCFSNVYSLIYNYFINGTTKLQLGHCAVSKALTRGCPQGSVLGPYLWNIGFDDFLSIPLPANCSLTGYADDGLLLIQSHTRTGVELLAESCLRLVADWGKRNCLEFAAHKTQYLMLKGNLVGLPRFKFNSITVKKKDSVCYLGLILEKKFHFIEHIKQVCEKSKRNFYALNRISTSTWGLSFRSLKIIYTATFLGCICYGAPVWADRATIGAARRKLLQSQRLALIFLCKAYRTVSTEALPILAGVIPVDLEIQRRAAMYYNSRNGMSSDFLKPKDRPKISRLFDSNEIVNKKLIDEWQTRWDTSIKGRHLFKFFPCVRERLNKTWIEIDHCVAQFLTGHGNFKGKLYSFNLVPSPLCECSTSDQEFIQTAHHILWECSLWHDERSIMLNSIQISACSPIYYTDLVETKGNFRAFKKFCHQYYWCKK